MTGKAPKARPRSYFWALRVKPLLKTVSLSDAASDGLVYARELATNARDRRALMLNHEPLLPRLTIDDLAEAHWVSSTTIRRRISASRIELFGPLSDAGIYYYLRQLDHRAKQPRTCAQPGCTTALPVTASAARRYCDPHRTPQARTARHRRH